MNDRAMFVSGYPRYAEAHGMNPDAFTIGREFNMIKRDEQYNRWFAD